MYDLNSFPANFFRGLVGTLLWLLATVALAQPREPESAASTSASPDGAQAATSSGTGEIRLSQGAYRAWDGDWDNPHFLFPEETTPVPARPRSVEAYLFGEDTGANSGTSSDVVVAYVSCSVSAHRPHRGKGPNGTQVTKAKASGSCTLTPTGQGPIPPESSVLWYVRLLLRDISNVVGYNFHLRTGYSPEWHQNPRDRYPGTQVFRNDYGCVNGSYTNVVSSRIIPPWPYTYVGPISLDNDREYGYVSDC